MDERCVQRGGNLGGGSWEGVEVGGFRWRFRAKVVDGEVLDALAVDALCEFYEPRFLDLELSHCCFIDLQKPLALLGYSGGECFSD